MANPQAENGHTDIAHDYLERLAKACLSGAEYQVMLFVIRKTWGWNKKQDKISYGQIALGTNLHRDTIIKTVKSLVDKQLLVKIMSKPILCLELQKDYDSWVVDKRLSPTKVVDKQLPPSRQTTTTTSRQTTTHKRKRKETITKENIGRIFFTWNQKEVIVHKKLDKATTDAAKQALKEFTLDEILEAIGNYAEIVNSDDYYFKYRWTLAVFLKGGGKDRVPFNNLRQFLTASRPFDNYRIEKKGAKDKKRGMDVESMGKGW